ncbi:rho GTPase-activating protein gacK [Condylostylus longicornis]|uniref:rho GTPase-activating protein gacK n=1 Tax=Condylostylus longicornis TaxID=2530218 RepID=UPI00244E1B9F|nr:rho GTPase-activating protein gacK [Condylostylus longicornis]
MTEDQQTSVPAKERKTNIHDIRNQDFVSRLLAATPPYLYSAPVGPNNFFFSDMLRSLVQAKNNENARNLQLQQAALARRPRKRSWSQHRPYYEHLKERKEMEDKIQTTSTTTTGSTIEKPLELTNKQIFPIASKYSKHLETLKENALQVSNKISSNSTTVSNQSEQKQQEYETNNPNHTQSKSQPQQQQQQSTNYECPSSSNPPIPDPPQASLPPSDLALPPPPPVWYPTLYPPYGIDPLHFFIDLRVSGHIYDRKKENSSPLSTENVNTAQNENPSTDGLVNKHRHGSAFTVPAPRNEKSSAINLSCGSSSVGETTLAGDRHDLYNKIYDLSETKENHFGAFKNANYVLQNLPKLYSQFANRDTESLERSSLNNDNKSEGLDDDDDIDEQRENSGHIDVELIGDRCQSPDDDDDVIHQID